MAREYEPGEKVRRLVDLIILLLRTSEGYTVTDLAERLGVTTRTIQRYLRVLQESSLDLRVRPVPNKRGSPTLYYRIEV